MWGNGSYKPRNLETDRGSEKVESNNVVMFTIEIWGCQSLCFLVLYPGISRDTEFVLSRDEDHD